MATWPTITDDDGSNTTGTIANNANIWNPIRDYIGTAWTAVTYASGNFTTDTGSWTVASGDQETYGYVEIGKTMHVRVRISTSTVASSPVQLRIAVPNGRTITGATHCGAVFAFNNGTIATGAYWQAVSGNSYIQIFRDLAANAWAGTDNVYVWAVFTFEIA